MNKKFLDPTLVLVFVVDFAKTVARDDQGALFGSEKSLSTMGVSNTLVKEVK